MPSTCSFVSLATIENQPEKHQIAQEISNFYPQSVLAYYLKNLKNFSLDFYKTYGDEKLKEAINLNQINISEIVDQSLAQKPLLEKAMQSFCDSVKDLIHSQIISDDYSLIISRDNSDQSINGFLLLKITDETLYVAQAGVEKGNFRKGIMTDMIESLVTCQDDKLKNIKFIEYITRKWNKVGPNFEEKIITQLTPELNPFSTQKSDPQKYGYNTTEYEGRPIVDIELARQFYQRKSPSTKLSSSSTGDQLAAALNSKLTF